MRTVRGLSVALAALLAPACSAATAPPSTQPSSSTSPFAPSASAPGVPAPGSPPSRAAAIREWKTIAGDHFSQSAAALEQVAKASGAEDEAALRSGCQRLHDTNSIGLQDDLPAPDVGLTEELQRMIDDMNSATHACMRFALGRNPADAGVYRDYLSRAVGHLQRAKLILGAYE